MIEAVLIVALVVLLVRALDRFPIGPFRGRRVTLHTKKPDDQNIHGALLRRWPDFVLVDAAYLTAGGKTAIPNRVRVPRSSVSWWEEH